MNTSLTPTLQSIDQAAVADELAAALTAVVSDASSPDSALAGLRKARNESLPPEKRAAVAALQAYGAECAADVLVAGLESDARDRASDLRQALEADSAEDALSLLREDAGAGAEFKSRLALRIASRCAEMIAADIERDKQGHFTILNEEDAAVFESRRAAHRDQRLDAASAFLASLQADLFIDIRKKVRQQIEADHKRPDIHAAVADLFDRALARMPEGARQAVQRGDQPGH